MNHREQAERFSKSLLVALKRFIDNSKLEYDDLPRWTRNSNIRLAELNGSTIIFFERSPNDENRVVEYREVESDVEFVFPNRTSDCSNTMFNLTENDGSDLGVTSFSNMTLSISSQDQCFTNIHTDSSHMPLAFHEVTVEYEPEDQIKAVRYLPFALFIPSFYLSDFSSFWDECAAQIIRPIWSSTNSPTANYRTKPMSEKGIMSNIEDTIIILGNYDDPYEDELRQIRDYLIRLGYDACLIKDLPAPNEMSLEEKVRLWTTASRFCVMADREASGHIKEYEIVKTERKPLILLRPEDEGSTWMIGDDELIDLNFIKTFNFGRSPLGATEEGIQWAENLLHERGKAYPDFYPWKETE